MSKDRKNLDLVDLLACAYLAGHDKSQVEIGRMLDLSQATVSRLLKQARHDNYLKAEPRFQDEKIDSDLMARVKHRVYYRQFEEKLHDFARRKSGKRGPNLRVFPSRNHDTHSNGIEEFGRHAAPFVKELLLTTSCCGVSWGTTLNGVVAALERITPEPPCINNPITVIPLGGESLRKVPNSFSSSYLAADLGKALNGGAETLSLSMVPAFIPGDFKRQDELSVIRKLISLVEGYERIFGSQTANASSSALPPLVEQVDMVLTSVGPAESLFGYIGSELVRSSEIAELQKLALGDICGVCIPQPGLSKENTAKLQKIINRWTGIRLDHLEACAKRAETKKMPGVVLIAIGKSKASFVLEVVKRGLVNTLIIDDDMEEQLRELVK